jgi:hypothetical protein
MGAQFKAHSPVETELWTVDNAKHASIMKSEHKDDYAKKILDYFDTSIKSLG